MLDYAIRNLGRSPTRLVLSVLGSALVVLLVIAATGFVRGMSASLDVSGSADNVIILAAGSEESIERSEVESSVPGVLEAALPGIRTRSGVAYVAPQIHVMLPARTPSRSEPRQVMIRGVTPTSFLVHAGARITDGRAPTSGADEIVVGRAAGVTLGVSNTELEPGKSVEIDGRPWTIVGRFAAPGTVLEGEIWADLADLKSATRRDTVSCVIVTLEPDEAEFADADAFTKMRPDLELVAMTEADYYSALAGFFRPIRIVAWVTAGLIGLGGLFGGLNTMYAAFASRVRELGTLQSLGFRRSSIVFSLVLEALLACSAGSLVAAAVGLFALDGLAVRFSMGSFGLLVDGPVIGAGLFAGLLLGFFGSLPPALRCLSLPIPVALKSI